MKAFVINLEKSLDRRAFVENQLSRANVDFEFTKAVDGSSLSEEYLKQVCDFEELAKRPYLLRKGVYGCALSHYNIYKEIIDKNLPMALILEDDVTIDEHLSSILEVIEREIKKNEAILLFSQNSYMQTEYSYLFYKNINQNHGIYHPIDIGALGSTAGYVITQEAARGMVDLILPIRYAADTWWHFYNEGAIKNIRCVLPYPIIPAGFESNIDYVNNTSLYMKLILTLKNINIFPIKQILLFRRRKLLKSTMQYSITNKAPKYKT